MILRCLFACCEVLLAMTAVQESPQSTRDWFWTVPLVTSAYNTVTSVYEGARDRNALTRLTLGTVESSVKLAGRCASPIVHQLESKLEKPLYAVDAFALKKLQELEASYPVIKKPSDEVLTQGKGVLMDTWQKGSHKVSKYPGAKLVGNGISVGSTVIGSTIKMGQQGINGTINAGRRTINTANDLVGRGVDRCLNATEVVVKYILPEEQEKSTMDEPLISSSTDNAKKERHRRRQERRKRREMRRAHRLSKTWAGRLERAQDIVCTTVDRTSDKMYEYMEWPIEHWDFVKTLRVAKAAATAYEMLEEYSEEARDCLKALNPLKAKEKKINLLTDDDDEEEEEIGVLEKLTTLACMVGAGVVYLPLHMATRSCELALILYDAAKDVPVTTTAMNYLGYGKEAVSISKSPPSQSKVSTMVKALVGFPIHVAVQAYEKTCGVSMYVLSKGQAISVVIRDESKEISMETVMMWMIRLKDLVTVVFLVYLEYAKLAIWGYGDEAVSVTKNAPSQSFTVVMNQQGDTPVIEDQHSDNDHTESSGDEESSDHDEPEHQSEDDNQSEDDD